MRAIPAGADSLPRSIYFRVLCEMYGIKQRLPSDVEERNGGTGGARGGVEARVSRICMRIELLVCVGCEIFFCYILVERT